MDEKLKKETKDLYKDALSEYLERKIIQVIFGGLGGFAFSVFMVGLFIVGGTPMKPEFYPLNFGFGCIILAGVFLAIVFGGNKEKEKR